MRMNDRYKVPSWERRKWWRAVSVGTMQRYTAHQRMKPRMGRWGHKRTTSSNGSRQSRRICKVRRWAARQRGKVTNSVPWPSYSVRGCDREEGVPSIGEKKMTPGEMKVWITGSKYVPTAVTFAAPRVPTVGKERRLSPSLLDRPDDLMKDLNEGHEGSSHSNQSL